MRFLIPIIALIIISGLIPSVFAQMTDEDEEVTLLGTQKVLNNVGQEYDERGKGVDVEYVLEGILLSNVDINQQENTISRRRRSFRSARRLTLRVSIPTSHRSAGLQRCARRFG